MSEEHETKKSCGDCGEMYDNDVLLCPRCGSGYFYYIYLFPEKDGDFWDFPEEHTFSIELTLTVSGHSRIFEPRPLKDYDIVR